MALDAKRKLYDVDSDAALATIELLNEEIQTLESLSAELKTEPDNFSNLVLFKESLDKAKRLVNKVTYLTYESRVIDSRGVWHRPNNAGYNELTLEGVEEFLDDLVHNNINSLYVETFFHGYVITPNNSKTEMHPWLSGGNYGEYGNDYLEALISEAHERGIEVHAWVQNFNVGFDGMEYPQFLKDHPEWIIYNDDATFLQRNEGGKYIFADPANPEVQEYLLDIYKELMDEYDFEGLHLDYIRYPVTYRDQDTGYTDYARNEFQTLNNLDGTTDLETLVKTDDDIHQKWTDYKTEKVTSFVKSVVDAMHEQDTKKIISTAIFPDTLEATIKKNQDWPTWVKNGWIDVTTPMAYYSGASTVESKVSDMVTYVDGITLNYGGIAPAFMGLPTESNPLQAQAVRNGEAFGTVIFASQNITGYGLVSDSFTLGIFSKKAVIPHDDIKLIIETMTKDMVGDHSKAERLYIPAGKMTTTQQNDLKTELTKIANMPYATSSDVEKMVEALEEIIDDIQDYGSGFADNRMKEDLTYLSEILQVRATRLEIEEGTWVQPGTEEPVEPTDSEEPTDPEEPTTCEDGFDLVDGKCVEQEKTGCFGGINTTSIFTIFTLSIIGLSSLIVIRKKQ